jgi:two-component system LytT family response regulator
MAHQHVSSQPPWIDASGLGRLGRQLIAGFAYWFAFDLVLEPGNIGKAVRAGYAIAWDQELLRLTGAGLLGAAATPLVLALLRRFPIEGPARWRRAGLHVLSSASLSAVLVALSCPLAALLLVSERRPLTVALREEMVGSFLLVTFCMVGFVAIAHALRPERRPMMRSAEGAGGRPAKQVPVKARGGLLMVEMAHIDWIETQGNYLALHVGAQTHLIRDSSTRFEATLDPARFIRIHRRTIVAIDRVRELTPVGGGDAAVRLDGGAEVRVSRGYRERLQSRLLAATTNDCPR